MSMDRVPASNLQTSNKAKEAFKGPMNTFVNVPEYPPARLQGCRALQLRYVVFRPPWLDMTKEPVVISAPDTDGRYYLLPMLDMWTDVFASPRPGERRAPRRGPFLITPCGLEARPCATGLPRSSSFQKDTQRIEAPTPYVWVIGRTKTDGPGGLRRGSQDPGPGLQRYTPLSEIWQDARSRSRSKIRPPAST